VEFRRGAAGLLSRGQRVIRAFKRGLYDFRVENEPLRWAQGYDFPAVRNGDVVRDEFKPGTPQPAEYLVFNTRRPSLQMRACARR